MTPYPRAALTFWDALTLSVECVSLHTYHFVFHWILSVMRHQEPASQTSLVVRQIRICLPVQGTQVWSLVQEDSTRHGTTKPVDHDYWNPHTLELALCNKRRHCKKQLQRWDARTLQLEKARAQQWRPRAANKWTKNILKNQRGRQENQREMWRCYTAGICFMKSFIYM